MPPEMRSDTAFMDRIHAYAPGWDFPKLNPHDHLTNHFGLVSDPGLESVFPFSSLCVVPFWAATRVEKRSSSAL